MSEAQKKEILSVLMDSLMALQRVELKDPEVDLVINEIKKHISKLTPIEK